METYILLNGFLGADIPEGEHEIKLVYHSPGIKAGLIMTIVGIVLFAVLIYIESKDRAVNADNGERLYETHEEIG